MQQELGATDPRGIGAAGLETVACDLCGADEADEIGLLADDQIGYFAHAFPLVRCRRCGLRYLRVRPTGAAMIAAYESPEMQRALDHRLGAIGRRLFWLRAHLRRRRVERWVRPGRALDVGCGSGEFLAVLAEAGWQVVGTEIDGRRVDEARRRLGAVVHQTTLEEADLAPGSFDLVTLWHVLEHLPTPRQTLQKAVELLRPGGLIAVAVPNAGSVEARVFGTDWSGIVAPWHLYYFTADTLRAMVANVGIEVVEVAEPLGYYSVPQSLARMQRRLGVKGLDRWRLVAGALWSVARTAIADRRWRGPSVECFGRRRDP